MQTVKIPLEVARLIRQAYLPTNPNRCRSVAPEVKEAVRIFLQTLCEAQCEEIKGAQARSGDYGPQAVKERIDLHKFHAAITEYYDADGDLVVGCPICGEELLNEAAESLKRKLSAK